MILLIDNYDSFVYNLSRYVDELGFQPCVVRNNEITLEQIYLLKPTHIIISPGPCTPNEAGISLSLVDEFYEKLPILGVCLGHQAIGQAFCSQIVRARRPMHGMSSKITHDGSGVFKDLVNPLSAARYHSLVIEPTSLPTCLAVTASSEEGEIMAVQHKELPVYGVQFHPESILTELGYQMIANFLGVRAKRINNPEFAHKHINRGEQYEVS